MKASLGSAERGFSFLMTVYQPPDAFMYRMVA
jgi:hypothetical protein